MLCQNCGAEIPENMKFCTECGTKVEKPVAATTPQPTLDDHNISTVWPDWQIEGKPLGKGSFGVVYKAVRKDHNVESSAAIKVISIPSDPSEIDSLRSEGLDESATRTYLQGIVNDFVSEIQLMESLKGVQNIVSVEDYKVVERTGEIGWDIYIRMELLTPFNAYICDKKLTEEEIVKLGCDICTALEICAKRSIIHRDIKPENIFINDFGHFKLGDFGIARKMENMTGGLSQKGTFNYMAPEVANSSEYDARVDTYSLGIVLYRLLNGNRLPFLDNEKQLLNANERRNAVERRIRGEQLPPPADASPAVADVILRACAYNPDARFSSATEMKQALTRVANGTYQIAESDLDKTTSVRRAPTDDYDKTTAVRKAIASSTTKPDSVDTFGSKPKKKSKAPAVIAILLIIALLVGAAIFVLPKLLGESESVGGDVSTESVVSEESIASTSSETVDYSEPDDDMVDSIISEADALAAAEDYEGAIAKIQTGLDTYPNSAKLQSKKAEYTTALNAQIKAKILEEAKTLADAGDYVSAIALIKDAQETYGDDADYQTALDTYSNAYKTAMIASADALAEGGAYLDAIAKINEAKVVLGEDADLNNKAQTYEDEYVGGVIGQVDSLIKKKDFAAAFTAVNEALKLFPNNAKLQQALVTIEQAQKQAGTADAKNPNQDPVLPKESEEYNISGASSKANAVAVQREDLYHSSFTASGQVEWFKFTTSTNYSAYSIEVLNNSIDTSVYVTIYDSYDNEINSTYAHKGDTERLDVSLEANTEYWIKVHRYNKDKTGNYQFSIKEKIRTAGMTKDDAFYIGLGSQYIKAFEIKGFSDWYRFTTTNNYATYQFALTNNSVDTSVYLTVYDEYDTEIGSVYASKGRSVVLDLNLNANREYTVKIRRYDTTKNGYYQMTVTEKISDAGLQQSEAFPLEIGKTMYGTLDTSFNEWFVCSFTQSGTYTLNLANKNVDTTVYATVYDALGTELGTISAGKNKDSKNSLEIAAGTVLYIKITRYDSRCFGNYTLLVN